MPRADESAGDVVRADLAALPARAAGEDDVQRHDLDVVLLDQRGRQVGRRIGDDGDGHPARLVRRPQRTDGTSRGRGAVRRPRRRRSRAPGRSPRDGRPPGTPRTLCRCSRHRDPWTVSSLQAQLVRGAKSRRWWGSRPSIRSISRPAVPPCVTTTATSAGGRSTSAASARSPTAAGASPPRSTTGCPEIQAAYWSGNRSATSARVSPSQRAHAVLAQSRLAQQRDVEEIGERRRRVDGPLEVAGHDDGAAAGQPGGQHGRRAGDLLAPDLVQRRIELPLEAAGDVPLRPAVPPHHHGADRQRGERREVGTRHRPVVSGAGEEPARELSTNGMVGQSFQSRSSA